MPHAIRQSDLEGYLDEALAPEEMARVEVALRRDRELLGHVQAIQARRNSGVQSLGEIWRQGRLSCPSREQLGSYLLGVLSDELAEYIAFHVEQVGCGFCRANLADLENQQAEAADAAEGRRRKYFQSSAGYLRREE
jgi:hypothetical protein